MQNINLQLTNDEVKILVISLESEMTHLHAEILETKMHSLEYYRINARLKMLRNLSNSIIAQAQSESNAQVVLTAEYLGLKTINFGKIK